METVEQYEKAREAGSGGQVALMCRQQLLNRLRGRKLNIKLIQERGRDGKPKLFSHSLFANNQRLQSTNSPTFCFTFGGSVAQKVKAPYLNTAVLLS